MVVFINEGESIKSVFDILTNYKVRAEYIRKAIGSSIFTEDSLEIEDLKKLDEVDKKSNKVTGTEKENLKELKAELKPFSIEDGLNLKAFYSLNVINNGNDKVVFISKLPRPKK